MQFHFRKFDYGGILLRHRAVLTIRNPMEMFHLLSAKGNVLLLPKPNLHHETFVSVPIYGMHIKMKAGSASRDLTSSLPYMHSNYLSVVNTIAAKTISNVDAPKG